MEIQPGRIFVAPPDHHLLLSPGHVHVTKGPKENLTRPAIDPLFRTAARFYGPRAIGVVLTGNLNDGTVGLVEVTRAGGLAVVQDPDDAQYPSMPASALRYVKVDHRARLRELGPLLVRLTSQEFPPEPAERRVSARLVMESKFASLGTLDEVEKMETIGTIAPYSCPECHGPVWRMNGEGPLRFRCHVGHAYTAETMQVGQAQSCEATLWDLLRTLEERAALLREMADSAKEKGRIPEASSWDAQAGCLVEDMLSLRQILSSGKSTTVSDQAPKKE